MTNNVGKNMNRYYYTIDGTNVEGPVTGEDLQGMVFSGQIDLLAQACAEGTEQWRPVTDVTAELAKMPKKQAPSKGPRFGQALGGIATAVTVIAGAWWYLGGVYETEFDRTMQEVNKQVDQDMRRIEKEIAADAVKQYEIAKRSGSTMDAYVQAGFAAAAFLQANDEANYQKWKAIERREGIGAGMDPSLLK